MGHFKNTFWNCFKRFVKMNTCIALGDSVLWLLCIVTVQFVPQVRNGKCWSWVWMLYFGVCSLFIALPANLFPSVMAVYSYAMHDCPMKYYDVCYSIILYGSHPNSTAIPRLVLREAQAAELNGISNPSDNLSNPATGSLLAKFVDFGKLTLTFAYFASSISYVIFLFVLIFLYIRPHWKKIFWSRRRNRTATDDNPPTDAATPNPTDAATPNPTDAATPNPTGPVSATDPSRPGGANANHDDIKDSKLYNEESRNFFPIYPIDFSCLYCCCSNETKRDDDTVLLRYSERTKTLWRTQTIRADSVAAATNNMDNYLTEKVEFDRSILRGNRQSNTGGLEEMLDDDDKSNRWHEDCPFLKPPTERDSLLTTSSNSYIQVFDLQEEPSLMEDDSFSVQLKAINSASFLIILLASVVLNVLFFWLFFQYGLHHTNNQVELNNENRSPNETSILFNWELAISIAYAYSAISSMTSCYIFSKIAYTVLQKCIKLSDNLYEINRPDTYLKRVSMYIGMRENADADKIRLEYLKKRYNDFFKVVKKTLCYFELWFFFHWILYVLTFTMSLALFIEAIHLKVLSDGPKKEGVDFSKYELILLGIFATSNSFFFLYPCFNAAAITESRGILIRKIHKITQNSLRYVPCEVIEKFETYLQSQKFSFEFRFLCFRIPFGYKIAIGSIMLSVFGFVLKFAIS